MLLKQNFDLENLVSKCDFTSFRYNTHFFTNLPLVVLASLVGAIGLAKNDASILIASMLFSPLGSQIIRSSIGFINGNTQQIYLGIVNHLLYVGIIVFIGYLVGLFVPEISNNKELVDRGTWTDSTSGIVFTIFLAILSGILLAMVSKNNDASIMVGIGIGASLLPPLIACGMFLSFSNDPEKMANTHSKVLDYG